MDYLGPSDIRNIYGSKNGDLYKWHIVLYTCASTRVVSLDIVPESSCQSFIRESSCRSFIRSLKRFISRYGIPKLFISDNSKNFVGQEFILNHYLQIGVKPWKPSPGGESSGEERCS